MNTNTPGFKVTSPCGRVWFVPILKVRDNYAEFLMDADGITRAEADAQIDKDVNFLTEWFDTQFDWMDVHNSGELVKPASPQDILLALNSIQNNSRPGDCSLAVNNADLATAFDNPAEVQD